jgi:3-(3-hydroxy-phenyl)propionate hydroxylase
MDADVAIIGCGPAGATLANLLGARGLQVLVLDRDAHIYPLPRAIHFDGEVMRVFETAGLRAAVEAISRPGLQGMHFNNADGDTLLIRGGSAARGPHGCANNHYFHQPDLEQVLRDGLKRWPDVQLRTLHEVTAIDDEGDGVTLQVTDHATGRPLRLRARYGVGCDGARSLVRKTLGSTQADLGLHQPWLVFDVRLKAEAPNLMPYTVQHCDPARPMTLCNVTGNRRRWEIMLMPGDDPAELVQPATIWRLIDRWLKPGQADIERAVIYTFHSVVAQGWRRGHLLLAGDAAHQTPPFLGQGMCAAVRDVANLAWKLDAVLRGRADDVLLDTYESERSPHVHAFIELAVQLGAIIQTTDAQAARERDARFRGGQPEVFHYPSPCLGPGVWVGDGVGDAAHTGGPVGQVFPQPELADGRLLDAALGPHFAWIGDPALLASADADTRARWAAHDVVCLPTSGAGLHDWLDRHHVRAVLLRPDRYVAGVARTAADLARVSACLPRVRAVAA